ncbi:hypothetical protein V6N12_009885 [Hibiscus sabdariffa]|uniref:Aminotransferase-like plant mobile domain-containing protein n=1 Tax=Hibiscus sabdariffa TaxID=183260 RepID=A0ABR2EC17_9ROSI
MLEWIALAQPPQSGVGPEDAEHVLRSFVATKGVWMRALPHDVKEEFFNLTFHEWLSRNLFDNSFVPNDEEWLIRFVILCWLLWKRKCSLLLASELGVIEDILVKGNIISTLDNKAGIGIVFRDDHERWLFGFARFVGHFADKLASRGHGMTMAPMSFLMLHVDIASLVGEELLRYSLTTIARMIDEVGANIDPGRVE